MSGEITVTETVGDDANTATTDEDNDVLATAAAVERAVADAIVVAAADRGANPAVVDDQPIVDRGATARAPEPAVETDTIETLDRGVRVRVDDSTLRPLDR